MMIAPWPASRGLRGWQEQAFTRVLQHDAADFLCVATPGAGKTLFALRVAHAKLSAGEVSRVVVVCSTEHLKTQWAEKASEVGINLAPDFRNKDGREAPDYHGAIVTYHQVASNPTIHRAECQRRTLVIYDEIHHVGDGLTWGNAMVEAHGPATFRLALSGTPFRSDGNFIPFVRYERGDDGIHRSQSNYKYDYGRALADEVCRSVLFPSFEGRMEWEVGGQIHVKTLTEEVSEEDNGRRLRTAVDPRGDWLRAVIRQANDQLTQVRANGHPDAGGLIIALDQAHARDTAGLLAKLTGEIPTLAVSDEPLASEAIKAFGEGTARWIVAVKMVSEGVDIPRLRVGVYATNVLTEMYFRQAVGRFVRRMEGIEEQSAYFFIPGVPALVGFAKAIQEERDHQIREEEERLMQEWLEGLPDELRPEPRETMTPLGSHDARLEDILIGGFTVPRDEFEHASVIGARVGVLGMFGAAMLALAFREHDAMRGQGAPVPAPADASAASAAPREDPIYVQKKRLRAAINRKVAQLAAVRFQEHRFIHADLNKADGCRIDAATLPQLQARLQRVNEWLDEARR